MNDVLTYFLLLMVLVFICLIHIWVPILVRCLCPEPEDESPGRRRPASRGDGRQPRTVATRNSITTLQAQDMVVINVLGPEKQGEVNIKSKLDVPKPENNSFKGSDDEECAICYSGSRSAESSVLWRVLPRCKHGFHADCIRIWLEINKTCPLCRKIIPLT